MGNKKRRGKQKPEPPPGPMEMGEFIKQLENAIHQATGLMERAMLASDAQGFERAAAAWRLASENWLMAAQGMSAEKARAFMVGHAMAGELAQWAEGQRSGPPPTVLELYKTS